MFIWVCRLYVWPMFFCFVLFVLNSIRGSLSSSWVCVCLCVWERVCECLLSRRGDRRYCSLAIAVFIYNDWAFAIQNVSLYIEYEYIYIYMIIYVWNLKSAWVYCFDNRWIDMICFVGDNLTQLCTMSLRGEERGGAFLFFFYFQFELETCSVSTHPDKTRKKSQNEVIFIPPQHESVALLHRSSTPLICIHVSLTWQGLSLFPVGSTHTHHPVLPQRL